MRARVPLSFSLLSSPKMGSSDFTLITSDGESLPVNRDLLKAHSTVFRDMLDVPQPPSKKDSCAITESTDQLQLLVDVVMGVGNVDWDHKQLDSALVLAEKYDIPAMRLQAKCCCW